VVVVAVAVGVGSVPLVVGVGLVAGVRVAPENSLPTEHPESRTAPTAARHAVRRGLMSENLTRDVIRIGRHDDQYV
jgi:hypothetical protein